MVLLPDPAKHKGVVGELNGFSVTVPDIIFTVCLVYKFMEHLST